MKNQVIDKLKKNWKSGLTVSLVSIPLSVSLAVASESTPVAGIITGIWAGLIASLFGGSNYNIVGPTGALSGLIASYAITHGAGTLGMLAIMAGLFTLIAYALRLERYLVFIPSSVIHGFTLGVAFIIGLNQLNFALGLHGLAKHEKFIDNIIESLRHLGGTSLVTVGIFLVFLAGLFAFRKLLPRLPGAVLLSPVGIILGYFASKGMIPLQLETLGGKFADISGKLFILPHFSFDFSLLSTGATIALIAILETMLSAKIADSMTKTKHNERKEMFALGLANIASGLTGGIPATAALARTSLNIKTGADSTTSATLNSIFMALISVVFLSTFKYIPMAVIAAILVYVAIQMIEAEHFIKFFHHDKTSFVVSLLVAFVTIYEDPIVGILFGAALSLVIFMEKISRGHFELVLNKHEEGIVGMVSGEKLKTITEDPDVLLYSFKGNLTYINSRAHIERFEQELSNFKTIILRLREVYFMDLDGIEGLDEIIEVISRKGQQVALCGASPFIKEMLEKNSKGYQHLKQSNLVFDKATQALAVILRQPKTETKSSAVGTNKQYPIGDLQTAS